MRRKRSDVRRGVLGKQLQIFNQNQSRAKKKEGQHPTKCITAVFSKERREDLRGQ